MTAVRVSPAAKLIAFLAEARATLADCAREDEPLGLLAIEVATALARVLELHSPQPFRWTDQYGPVVVCRHCAPLTYPCDTVRTVSESLGVS